MDVISTVRQMQEYAEHLRCSGKKIGFVPTMGYLHAGHLSLIQRGHPLCSAMVVSIFVNPAQFAPGEDFEAYPRNFDRDRELLEAEKVDILFYPDTHELYPQGFQTCVNLDKLPKHLCGLSRPVFFGGVATVVTKLFHIVKPHVALFGEKDYQQLMVIRRMVFDLNMDIQIVGCPTVREPDGLAMSSRNAYLTAEQRPAALTLCRSLERAGQMLAAGVSEAHRLIGAAKQIITSYSNTHIDYISICDPETLEEMERVDRSALMALAVKVGTTRLIDNRILSP